MNNILDRRIFSTRCPDFGNNTTIVKIRNYDRIRIITESDEMGEVIEMDNTDRCDLGTKEGTLMLRKSLNEVMKRDNIRHVDVVDVGFPTSVLKVNFCLHR